MAYARFSDSDVYMFASADGFVCMCCRLTETATDWYGDTIAQTRAGMLAHMRQHEAAGHDTGGAIPRLLREMSAREKGTER